MQSHPASYRDTAGFVFQQEGNAVPLCTSGLRNALYPVNEQRLV